VARSLGNADRAHLARELHDGLAQDLWVAKLTASQLLQHESLDEHARGLCASLLRSIDSALTEARSAVAAMRPGSGRTTRLPGLLREQIDDFAARFGTPVELVIEGEPIVTDRVSVELLRILQEALNNVRKHACAKRVVVELRSRRSTLVLSVRDDGVGFDPSAVTPGYGRDSMAERAELIGARLTITSAPGRGTHLTLRVPLQRRGGR
jgi:signal transduction histidine kinase